MHNESAASTRREGGLVLQAGARPLPDFELSHRLGSGSYGEVWKARGPGNVPLALKFIRLDGKAHTIEQRALALMKDLRHPHLLGLFGFWERHDHLIVAMELADRTLLERLQEAQGEGLAGIPFSELDRYVHEASAALDYLNGQGVQHRDIKPQNLLLAGGGLKVADFGLAKLLEHTLASNTGHFTPSYAAPEFFNGQTSGRSDQYCLGVSYCQLRGGRLPFEGTLNQVMFGHVMHAPDLTMVPEAEQPAVARALAKGPADRWPDCRSFADALARSHGPDRLPQDLPTVTYFPAGRQPRFPLREFTNGLGMKLVLIPAGKFWMGSAPGADTPEDEKPRREVEISRGFYLGVYPVTQEEYEKVTGTNPSWFSSGRGRRRKVEGLETARLPVENVSWEDALAFCQALTNYQDIRKPPGTGYDLPTEAEWEYACRAGQVAAYFFGDDPARLGDFAWHEGNAEGRPHEVGTKFPNGWGLFDMHGNVWQWCRDRYSRDSYHAAEKKDPQGARSGRVRVMRGGSWGDQAGRCRAACRGKNAQGDRSNICGLRVCYRLD